LRGIRAGRIIEMQARRMTAGLITVWMAGACAAFAEDMELRARFEVLARGASAPDKPRTLALSYASAPFNGAFACPQGWAISRIDTVDQSVYLTVSKPQRHAVLVRFTRNASAGEASLRPYEAVLTALGAVQKAAGLPPETDAAQPDREVFATFRYVTFAQPRFLALMGESRGAHSRLVAFAGAQEDYGAHQNDYYAVMAGASFLDTSAAAYTGPAPDGPGGSAQVDPFFGSEYFNAFYRCAPGWQIAHIDTDRDLAFLRIAKEGRSDGTVYLTRNATAAEADLRNYYAAFLFLEMLGTPTASVPRVTAYRDTAQGEGRILNLALEYGSGGRLFVQELTAMSQGLHSHHVRFADEETGYDAHLPDYRAMMAGLSFNARITGVARERALPGGLRREGRVWLNPRGLRVEFHGPDGRARFSTNAARIDPGTEALLPRVR
jgi:hypothetical protein